jgi:hypothetical protein
MPPTPPAKAAAERAPATGTSIVNDGVEALTQMIRLKTTRSPQQRRPSSTSSTPRVWRGDVTLPGARRGGVPPPCERRERELSGRPPRRSGSNWRRSRILKVADLTSEIGRLRAPRRRHVWRPVWRRRRRPSRCSRPGEDSHELELY